MPKAGDANGKWPDWVEWNEDSCLFTLAANNIDFREGTRPPNTEAKDYRNQEWAGVTFSPDGKWLFANIQTPGVTFAITGPWERGQV